MPATQRLTIPAALLLGAALGLAGLREAPLLGSGQWSLAKGPAPHQARSLATTAATTPRPTASASAYASAWDSLKDGQLPKQERNAIQCAIVREWAMVDLSAAIRAVVSDQESRFRFVGFDDPMRNALHAGIAAQPDTAWHLIETHAFGLHTKWLREAWITAAGPNDPKKLMERLFQFPSHERYTAMKIAVESSHSPGQSQTVGEEVVAVVLALPKPPNGAAPRKTLVSQLRSTVGYPGLLDIVLRTQDPEIRGIYLEAYLGITAGIPLDRDVEPEWKSEIKSLPASIREEAEQILRDQPEMRWGG